MRFKCLSSIDIFWRLDTSHNLGATVGRVMKCPETLSLATNVNRTADFSSSQIYLTVNLGQLKLLVSLVLYSVHMVLRAHTKLIGGRNRILGA